ncbi:MAG: hypothetical protein KAH12_03070, partial [Anaerolineales bacterium]|nr:hypothetical protein [Anaerolineales bacterium]
MKKSAIMLSALAGMILAANAQSSGTPNYSNFVYSVDIGSDWEISDPHPAFPNIGSPDVMDPGDMYAVPMAGQQPPFNRTKDDELIFGTDINTGGELPWPDESNPLGTAVPIPAPGVQGGTQEDAGIYFDMDGEDQLDTDFQIIIEGEMGTPGPGTPLVGPVTATPGGGLLLDPDRLIFSYDDDQAPAWWSSSLTYPAYGDVPVTAYPDYGINTNEILFAQQWLSWTTDLPCARESDIGLGPDPYDWQQEAGQERDDDVDALDNEYHRYWYWSSDHEAHFGTDPADIYVTDRNYLGANYTLAIDNLVLGVPDGTDVDAFEFCVTSDDTIINYFNNDGLLLTQLDTNKTYLAVVFSVDQNDPSTLLVDESGMLLPNGIYISLLTGQITGTPSPMLVSVRVGANGMEVDEEGFDDDDVDAITFEEEPEPTEDWGDAPDSLPIPRYPTLSIHNGARHTMVHGIYLGSALDGEFNGQPTVLADGDDIDAAGDDEDGVIFTSRLYQNHMASLRVIASTNGYLNAWIDFGANFSWADPIDQICINWPVHKGVNHITFSVSPSGVAAPYQTYARFRFTHNQLIPAVEYGLAPDGEVEDYLIKIEDAEEGLQYDFGDADMP